MHRLTESNPLTITIDPVTVYISTNPEHASYANFTVSIQNSSSASIQASWIAITLPDALAPYDELQGITPVAAQPDLWNFNPSQMTQGEFDAAPQSGNPALAPGDQWQFTLQNVTLVNSLTQQSANVTAVVTFADSTTQTQQLTVGMDPATATIVYFDSQPPTVNPGETAVLQWKCVDIDYVIISAIDSSHRGPIDSADVAPNSLTVYTLYAYGDNVILSAQWTVQVGNAGIVSFGGADGISSVSYGNTITLVWVCNQYTESISLSDDTGVEIPTGLLTGGNTLQNGSVTVGPIVKPTTFIFTAFGNTKANYDQLEPLIDINDVSYSLTASPDTGIWQLDNVTLYWNISSASAVSIDPPLENGPSLQNLVGSAPITPVADITYTLNVSGFTDNVPASYQYPLSLSVEQVAIGSFIQLPSTITPDSGPNACTLQWTANAQVVWLSGFGNVNPNPNSSVPLTAPPNGATYTLMAGTIQNPNQMTAPVVISNSYGPYTFTSFQPDTSCANAFDLMVTDTAPLAFLKEGVYGGYAPVLTGLTVTSAPAQLVALSVYDAPDGSSYFMLLNEPGSSDALALEWTNSGEQYGTITLQQVSEEHLAAREAYARLQRLKKG